LNCQEIIPLRLEANFCRLCVFGTAAGDLFSWY